MNRSFGRRTLFKGTFVAVTAFALTAFETALVKVGAHAAATWSHCAVWDPLASNDWWTECNPYAGEHPSQDESTIGNDQISNYYCNGNGYHRFDDVYEGSGLVHYYAQRPFSCAERNAWEWRIEGAEGWQNKRSRRCSDGKVRAELNGVYRGTHHTVCQEFLPAANPPPYTLPWNKYTPDGCPPGDNPDNNPAKC